MLKIIGMGYKTIFSFLMLTILATFLALGAFSVPANAQPGADPNYKYPILAEKDFSLFLALMSYISEKKDPSVFFQEQNVTEEYTQAVVVKISMNAMAKLMDKTGELEQEMGKSILFTPSEDALYQKYENEILSGLVQIGLDEEAKEN
jgi:hypothetical protein